MAESRSERRERIATQLRGVHFHGVSRDAMIEHYARVEEGGAQRVNNRRTTLTRYGRSHFRKVY